jgi:glutamate decarboxylase
MSALDPSVYKLSEEVANLKYDDLLPQNPNSQKETREFLQKVIDILMDYAELCFNRDELVLDFHKPECLRDKIDVKIGAEGAPLSKLIEDCATALKFQVKSGHPRFLNQLANGLDIVSMAGEWLAVTANANMFTYEVSPVFITMEDEVLQRMRTIIGYTGGESILAPGGAISNLYGVLLARFKMFPEVKNKGLASLPGTLVMFTSDQSHFSINSAAAVSGVGLDNCIAIETDWNGRMIPAELEKKIIEQKDLGKIPFMVNATAGTTVLGAFDPMVEISEICKRHGLWMHVDVS